MVTYNHKEIEKMDDQVALWYVLKRKKKSEFYFFW